VEKAIGAREVEGAAPVQLLAGVAPEKDQGLIQQESVLYQPVARMKDRSLCRIGDQRIPRLDFSAPEFSHFQPSHTPDRPACMSTPFN
jgi:hypothetical protein